MQCILGTIGPNGDASRDQQDDTAGRLPFHSGKEDISCPCNLSSAQGRAEASYTSAYFFWHSRVQKTIAGYTGGFDLQVVRWVACYKSQADARDHSTDLLDQ
jgi:hypothetical protein